MLEICIHGAGFFSLLVRLTTKSLKAERLFSLLTKNKKLSASIKDRGVPKEDTVPIINLSNQELSGSVLHYLRHGLDHSFVNKSRRIKLNLATEMENLLAELK